MQARGVRLSGRVQSALSGGQRVNAEPMSALALCSVIGSPPYYCIAARRTSYAARYCVHVGDWMLHLYLALCSMMGRRPIMTPLVSTISRPRVYLQVLPTQWIALHRSSCAALTVRLCHVGPPSVSQTS